MGVSGPVWFVIIAVIVALVLLDYLVNIRRTRTPTLREAAVWSAVYVGIAIAFGVGVWDFGGISMSVEYFDCYVSNEALSIDNLFVFLFIVSSFAVPRIAQQKVLLFGIVLALAARTVFIFIGAALVAIFDWAFYLFAIVLLIMATNLAKSSESRRRDTDTVLIRIARRLVHTSEDYDGDRLFTVEHGRRVMTPMLLVMLAVGGADILFAFDSIPALFGLSQNVYLVFSATALSLLGLRQLYFLIDCVLDRLVYLSYGLAAILAFIGVNLMLQALHDNNIPFINGGNPVPVAEPSTTLSLTVIIVILLITTAASLLSPRGRAQHALAGARRHAAEYLDQADAADPVEREKLFTQMLAEEGEITALPTKYRRRIRRKQELMKLLGQAHRAHDAPAPGSRSASSPR
ncbi:TerC/Alx family metal homeostasis membrane protein [Mycobacterium sp.]|uniref:TerC/Alx family metal homeostasis membrane protein n=1 Tax=Mycobacterium sp. TaxID=1785 RepID=UPI003F9BD791